MRPTRAVTVLSVRGGPRKDSAQIKNLKNAHLAIDDIEQGSTRRIPLWLFGFLC
ncbi:MAG: hypothetical protein ACLFVC_04820 [Opitutales bacterium]